METKEKMRIASGAVILLTLGVLVLLSSFGIYSLDKSWPILIIVFALFTLVQSQTRSSNCLPQCPAAC